ncbi:MAG: hypothetical protein H6741_09830 [Alphaproteobacteria bacterium]|nr:hypothetical protein [Alphaproteobacteria bacterium]MCB9793011.1 hypothetical protein [Alphaproteobacteria bacterium]
MGAHAKMALALPLVLGACSASVAVNANVNNAEIYITDYAPSPSAPPSVYEAKGTGDLYCDVNYYAWEEYYMWVGAPGYKTQVSKLRHEPKVGPIVVAILGSACVFPLGALIWAYGPEEGPYNVELQPVAPQQAPANQPLAIPGF